MGLREEKRRRTREAIVGSASRLFAERGYRETTVVDIAAAAAVAPRTFFLHFASKEDLLFAHVEEYVGEAARAVLAAPAGSAPVDAVAGAVGLLIDRFPEIASLAAERSRVLGAVAGPPLSLVRRLVGAHAELTAAARERFDDADPVDLAALVGAALGSASSAAAAARGTDAATVQGAMRAAVERAARGFRD